MNSVDPFSPDIAPVQPRTGSHTGMQPSIAPSLLDLRSDGFYLLLLLRRGQLPTDQATFIQSVQHFLQNVERQAGGLGLANEDVVAAKYAFCAAVDEAILSQPSPIHASWERNPLQLRLFGEHLAGEHFFDRLELSRQQGLPRLPSLEVYHYCLLLGFKGKYRLEGEDKLVYVTTRLGDEIAFLKGRRAAFAPHSLATDSVLHTLRRVMPVWLPIAAVAAFGIITFLAMRIHLDQQTRQTMAGHVDVVKMPERTPHITITLP